MMFTHAVCAGCLLAFVLLSLVLPHHLVPMAQLVAAVFGLAASLGGLTSTELGSHGSFIIWLFIFGTLCLVCLAPVSH